MSRLHRLGAHLPSSVRATGVARLAGVLTGTVAALLLVIPSGASATVANTGSAAAASVVSPTSCGGDVCFVTSPAPGTLTSGFWFVAADGRSFHGRFRVAGPNIVQYSPVRTWRAHGLDLNDAAWFTRTVHLDHGVYCVQAYSGTSNHSLGRACLREPVRL